MYFLISSGVALGIGKSFIVTNPHGALITFGIELAMIATVPELSNLKKGNIVTVKKLSEDIYSVSVKGKT